MLPENVHSFKGNQRQKIIFELQNSKVKTMWTFCTFENSKNLCSTYLITLKEVKISEVQKCKSMYVLYYPVGCLSLEKLNWDSQQGRDLPQSGRNNKKISIRPIFFLYYEESLV